MPPKKKPFSNKQKKAQLHQKRQRKKDKIPFGTSPPKERVHLQEQQGSSDEPSSEDDELITTSSDQINKPLAGVIAKPPTKPHPQAVQTVIRRYDPNRFQLHFHQESKEDIERNKLKAKKIPIIRITEEELEVGVNDIYQPGSVLDIPARPVWDYSMSKDQVERHEEEMFSKYVRNIFAKYSPQELSYFELNLETWRQLWRVLEISDLVLLITDIRHPALHFSPALYKHVTEDLKKEIVLILNKIDLVPPQVAVAWKHYFTQQFPDLSVVCFSSFPNKEASLDTTSKAKFKLRKKGGFRSAIGQEDLYNTVEKLCKHRNVDMSLWRQKLDAVNANSIISTSSADEQSGNTSITCVTSMSDTCTSSTSTSSTSTSRHCSSDQFITIGLLGHPNVGKSSLLNGLMGKKSVSTSRTPGHTKHFQTMFLTPNIRLCDCPGLVFPSLVKKQLQILSGIYPIAQVKEPYSVVGYLAQCLPLVKLLSLNHPDHSAQCGSDISWTPWDICDAWAEKRGYYTRRGGKPDTYRAANDLLRLTSDGRICLYFRPPGFHKNKVYWDTHSDVLDMIRLQTDPGKHSSEEEGEEEDTTDEERASTNEGSDDSNPFTTSETKFSALMNLQDDITD